MIDISLYRLKLRALRNFIFDTIDGKIGDSLDERYWLVESKHQIRKINSVTKIRESGLIIVTDHAYNMAKERLSMNGSSFHKLSEKAFYNGVKHGETIGNLRKYIDGLFLRHKTAGNIRIYGENIFFFAGNFLLTVYQVPLNLRKATNKIQKEKKHQSK